jgi:homoserine O-succinyltransferase
MAPVDFRESDANCLDIGLVNNMPDAALEATERQFLTLLDAAADGIVVRLTPYALPEVPRTDPGRRRVGSFYAGPADLWDSHLDGLIVTGTEPRAPDLKGEPYWESLTRVLEWADENTHSTVWSCLAAHAALLYLDGIGRRPLSDKRFGVFECARVSDHCLTAGAPSRLSMPHSRWNDIPEDALTSSGYRVLTRSDEAGVDLFVKQRGSLFVFFQGHPEYEANTLLLEYRRDVKRYLRRERETYPPLPRRYFDDEAVAALTALEARARSERREKLLEEFPVARLADRVTNTWRPVAARVYRNWLLYLSARKARRLLSGRAARGGNGGRPAARRGSHTHDIRGFEIQPLLGPALPEVAGFLHRWHAGRAQGSSGQGAPGEDAGSPAGRLRWLDWLLVENPFTTADAQHGLCLRDASGVIAGVLLAFPGVFLAGDQRLRGLGSGSFFVEPRARTLGLYLFKRYLSAPDYSFFFSTTCNANSAALWKALGASAVPDTDTEYMLPLRLDVVLPVLLASRTGRAWAAELARVVGRFANPLVRRLARTSSGLSVEPCRDWEKLAALFRRHRSPDSTTTDRSPRFLEWRYGQNANNHPFDVCVVRDTRGQEGWFALGHVVRELQRTIHGRVLLDAVWPRGAMSFGDILPAILQRVAADADAVFFQPRRGVDYRECGRWIIPCRLEAPKIFAITRKGGAPLAVSSLDLVPADGDGAF